VRIIGSRRPCGSCVNVKVKNRRVGPIYTHLIYIYVLHSHTHTHTRVYTYLTVCNIIINISRAVRFTLCAVARK